MRIFQSGKTIHAKQDGVSTAIELHAAEMVPEEGRTSEEEGGRRKCGRRRVRGRWEEVWEEEGGRKVGGEDGRKVGGGKHDMYYGRKYLMVKEYDQEQGEGGEEEKVWGRGAICMELLL